jgi:hypothetical protein
MMRRTIGRSKLASHGQVLVVEGHENRAVFIQVESNQAVSMEEDKHTLGSENGSWGSYGILKTSRFHPFKPA